MARANRRRVFRLPRCADEQRGDQRIPLPRHRPLAPASLPAQSEAAPVVARDGEAGQRVSPQTADPSSLAECALCRQTPEVGAECPNWARSDLCGGRSAMNVPTANTALLNRHPPDFGSFGPRIVPFTGWCNGKSRLRRNEGGQSQWMMAADAKDTAYSVPRHTPSVAACM